MPFDRSPSAHAPAREVVVETDGVALSGLLAEPERGSPRALLVAVHGVGLHAGYFHSSAAPGLSLLELGRELGFSVWAPDRPGVGASADLPNESLTMRNQATILRVAVGAFGERHEIGAGVVMVGHSYGLKVALLAAAEGVPALLGIDGSGTGTRLAPLGPPKPGEAGPAWGPRVLYPRAVFQRANMPLDAPPVPRVSEAAIWPEALAELGPRVTTPLRFTFGEHERYFSIDRNDRDALERHFPHAPNVRVEIEPGAGHNISLGWAARAYHLKVLAFAEQCLVRHRLLSDHERLERTITPATP